jgi:hypothetical protein
VRDVAPLQHHQAEDQRQSRGAGGVEGHHGRQATRRKGVAQQQPDQAADDEEGAADHRAGDALHDGYAPGFLVHHPDHPDPATLI